ncbi:MAG: glycerate kinase [Firmicutes bacterium]|nr:glycerate kinase [Bacillota bacterium]
MKIVIAPDKYKGSLTALEVAKAIATGLRRVLPNLEVVEVPMADGGEGTVQSLVDATGGTLREVEVTGPLGERRPASYGILGDGRTAVIEMAAASGLALVPRDRRNPLITTTRGTGDLIKAALDEGCTRLIIGIGGSATNDAGAGMAQALGARLLDVNGQELGPGGAELARLARIDLGGLDSRIRSGAVEVVVACDVANPLTGPQGASSVYGPQKGATPEMVQQLDAALANFARVVKRDLGLEVDTIPGAGAAGGLGAGLIAFLGGELKPGVEIVLEVTGLVEKLEGADLVITGEGAMDGQTAYGKTPSGVARVAKERGIPVIAIVGTVGKGIEEVYGIGIDAVFSIINRPCTLEEAMAEGAELIVQTAENIGRLLMAAGRFN